MSFRAKLTIAFTSVMLLIALIALTNWWGIGSALKRQDSVYLLTSRLEKQFHLMTRQEQLFRASETIEYSRAVRNTLSAIRSQLDEQLSQANHAAQASIDAVLASLKEYETSFTVYNDSVVAMQTIESRLLKESQRLLGHAGELGSGGQNVIFSSRSIKDLADELNHDIGNLLLAEKNFILTDSGRSAEQVRALGAAISTKAKAVEHGNGEQSVKLKAFRVALAAETYLTVFSDLVAEKDRQRKSAQSVTITLDGFATALDQFVERSKKSSGEQINTMQLLSAIISLLAVAIGFAAIFILSNLISKPVNELRKSAQHIVDGNLDTRVNITGTDDISKLGLMFNEMTRRLRDSFRHIENYRDHLKELVEERTIKLEQEINHHHITEEALRASSERLANIVAQSPVGIVIFDRSYTIIEWNPSCEKLFGYSREEIVGRNAHILVPAHCSEQVDGVLADLLQKRISIRNQNENITKSGQIITCDWYNTPLTNQDDEVVGMLCLVENITEKLRVETELLKVKKLESTGVLAGGIAHDFNNILTAVLGNISLSLLDNNLQDNTRQLLHSAEQATIRAQKLTQQLLTFAKGGEPLREQTSLVDIIRDSAEFIMHGSSASCRYRFPEDLWLVKADKGQLSQVIQNIVLNASQAMPDGGIIDITCENITNPGQYGNLLSPDETYVKIAIADQGIGIAPPVLEKIFDPYFSTKKEGSGLGLAITLSIVNKHGGHISVQSETGHGAVFTIFLPADRSASPPATAELPQLNESRQVSVLVMDDDVMVVQVLTSMLSTLGHQVIASSNGDQCVDLYRRGVADGVPPDLVILDLTIPGGKGGDETVKEIKLINPNARVIVSSGYSNDPIVASYHEYGFCAALSKPYVLQELAQTIDRSLSQAD